MWNENQHIADISLTLYFIKWHICLTKINKNKHVKTAMRLFLWSDSVVSRNSIAAPAEEMNVIAFLGKQLSSGVCRKAAL